MLILFRCVRQYRVLRARPVRCLRKAARSVGRRPHIAQGHSEVRAKCAGLPPAVPFYWRHRRPQMICWTTGVCGHCAVHPRMSGRDDDCECSVRVGSSTGNQNYSSHINFVLAQLHHYQGPVVDAWWSAEAALRRDAPRRCGCHVVLQAHKRVQEDEDVSLSSYDFGHRGCVTAIHWKLSGEETSLSASTVRVTHPLAPPRRRPSGRFVPLRQDVPPLASTKRTADSQRARVSRYLAARHDEERGVWSAVGRRSHPAPRHGAARTRQ